MLCRAHKLEACVPKEETRLEELTQGLDLCQWSFLGRKLDGGEDANGVLDLLADCFRQSLKLPVEGLESESLT